MPDRQIIPRQNAVIMDNGQDDVIRYPNFGNKWPEKLKNRSQQNQSLRVRRLEAKSPAYSGGCFDSLC
jgi:hypothetical protein